MTINKTWKVDAIDQETEDGLIVVVHWKLDATGQGKPTHLYGTVSLERGDSFVPFEQLTEDVVIGWVKDKLGEQHIIDLEEAVENQFNQLNREDKVTTTLPQSFPTIN